MANPHFPGKRSLFKMIDVSHFNIVLVLSTVQSTDHPISIPVSNLTDQFYNLCKISEKLLVNVFNKINFWLKTLMQINAAVFGSYIESKL